MSLRQHRPILAIALISLAMVLLSVMGAAVKYLGQALPAGEMIFVRNLIGIAALMLMAWRMRELQWLKTRNWRPHLLRGTFGTVSMFTWFMALSRAPIADATVITSAAPIFVTVLAIPFLGERIHAYRWTAVVVGFCGVLVIMVPSMSFQHSEFSGLVLALLSALAGAFARIYVRGMSNEEHPITITFYFTISALLGGACTFPWGWPAPTGTEWLVLILIGVLGIAGQTLLNAAFRYAEVSMISSLEYVGVIASALLGYFIFDELPGSAFWIGAPLVIAAGLLILWREYQLLSTPIQGKADV
jgi:drug/metabolite transporter (DMT)-like permease